MDLDDDAKVEVPSPGAEAETGDVTVVPETAHATATAFSPRVATHSHYLNGTEEIVIGGEGFRSSSLAAGEDLRLAERRASPQRRGLGSILAIALSRRRR
jgi:hypothetical protein